MKKAIVLFGLVILSLVSNAQQLKLTASWTADYNDITQVWDSSKKDYKPNTVCTYDTFDDTVIMIISNHTSIVYKLTETPVKYIRECDGAKVKICKYKDKADRKAVITFVTCNTGNTLSIVHNANKKHRICFDYVPVD